MNDKTQVIIHGVESPGEVPGLDAISGDADFVCTSDAEALRTALPGTPVLLGWDFRAGDLEGAWDSATDLRWIQWAGAGVDTLLFPNLVESDVMVTNMRGIFDRPMAEYALGLVLALAKGFPETLNAQRERRWAFRLTERIEGSNALVVGVGSIGRVIARFLRSAGMNVHGVGRTARGGDPDFGRVHGIADLDRLLAEADYVVLITPLTAETRGLFGAAEFAAMKPTARFINIGRGALVDETALVEALTRGAIAGAGLDVYETEPLPEDSPFWSLDNVILSPHMSGDYKGCHTHMAEVFLDNFHRYRAGEPLRNVVDKRAGFVPSSEELAKQ